MLRPATGPPASCAWTTRPLPRLLCAPVIGGKLVPKAALGMSRLQQIWTRPRVVSKNVAFWTTRFQDLQRSWRRRQISPPGRNSCGPLSGTGGWPSFPGFLFASSKDRQGPSLYRKGQYSALLEGRRRSFHQILIPAPAVVKGRSDAKE